MSQNPCILAAIDEGAPRLSFPLALSLLKLVNNVNYIIIFLYQCQFLQLRQLSQVLTDQFFLSWSVFERYTTGVLMVS